MSNFEILMAMYVLTICLTVVGAIVYLCAEIRNSGGATKYFRDRGFSGSNAINIAWAVAMIAVLTWIMTPVATVLCRDAWLHNDFPYNN